MCEAREWNKDIFERKQIEQQDDMFIINQKNYISKFQELTYYM